MEIAAAAMDSLIPKLASLLQENPRLHKPVKQEIELLKQELEELKAAVLLHGSEITGVHHPAADDSLSRKLRELSYDIEDSVDKLFIQRHRARHEPAAGCLRTPVFFKKLAALHQIAKRIGSFKSRVKELSARYYATHNISHDDASSFFRVEGSTKRVSSGVTVMNRPSSSLNKTEDALLVGVDRPRDELIAKLQLLPEKAAARLKVLSIVGVGGIGKTTLAREVYHKVQKSFACRAWVSVSRNPNTENILMGLLRQVEDDPHSTADGGSGDDVRGLIARIKKCLEGKRFLLVLDDIWSTNTWEVIELALPLDSCGSRVITTTRNYDVAAACSSDWNGYIYQVIPLSSKDSWMLFSKGITGSTGTFPSHLDDVSDKILERCSGVPLAIITMSRLLANKPTLEDASRYISAAPLLPIEEISNILLLSYNDLPHHLKVCFLYLSIFPEDYPISYAHIIRCWIAEGFITENDLRIPMEEGNPNRNPGEVGKHMRTLEEVGESYLSEFINRSMIHPVHGCYDGKSECFRIHSLILDLIKHISVRNDFVTLVNNEEPLSVLHSKVRRLSIFNINEYHDITTSMDMSHVHSLYIFGGVGMKITSKNLRFLRVLNLEGCKDLQDHIIKEIPGLLSLRYLSIRDTPVSELPKQIELQPQGSQLNSSCYLSRIPEWLTYLPSLIYVSIDIEEVKNEDLQLLSKLRSLLHLSLLSKIVPTEKLVISSDGFQCLRVFHLYSARADITFEPQAMHKLEELLLSIRVPPEEIFGFSIGQFECLKKIDIRINGNGEYALKLFQDANDSIRKAADEHPDRPTVDIICWET